jgi:hypothetical protein
MRETPGQMAGNCLATAVIGFILFDITSMMSNAPLTVDDLRATIEKCDQVESPAPADNLRHDPTKRVTKRRRR